MGGLLEDSKETVLPVTETDDIVRLLRSVARLCGDDDRESNVAAEDSLAKLAEYSNVGNLSGRVGHVKRSLGDVISLAIPELVTPLQSPIDGIRVGVSDLFAKLAGHSKY